MEKQLVFLTHMSRSGSTFLSKLLDQHENISVGIEGFFPDNVIREAPNIDSERKIDKYLNLLFMDKRFRGWDLKKRDIKNELLNINFPIPYKKILLTCFKLYFNNKLKDVLIHKCGWYIGNTERARLVYGNIKFIHIIRDPRGIYNSQKHSKLFNNKGKSHPITFCINYKKMVRNIFNANIKNILHVVKYENLLISKNDEINNILEFLKINSKNNKTKSDYINKIPENLKNIHKNVGKDAIKKRADAWKKELDKDSQFFIQMLCKKEIKDYNYELVKFKLSDININKTILWIFGYLYISIKLYIKNLISSKYPADVLIENEIREEKY